MYIYLLTDILSLPLWVTASSFLSWSAPAVQQSLAAPACVNLLPVEKLVSGVWSRQGEAGGDARPRRLVVTMMRVKAADPYHFSCAPDSVDGCICLWSVFLCVWTEIGDTSQEREGRSEEKGGLHHCCKTGDFSHQTAGGSLIFSVLLFPLMFFFSFCSPSVSHQCSPFSFCLFSLPVFFLEGLCQRVTSPQHQWELSTSWAIGLSECYI